MLMSNNLGDAMKYWKESHYLVLTISKDFHNFTILELLKHYHSSKKLIHHLRMSKDVFLNGKNIKQDFSIKLSENDELKLPIFIDEDVDFLPDDKPIDIAYEDDFILVVNKPPQLEVHPDSKNRLGTLVNRVSYYYQITNQNHRVRYIHRLDRDTTGLIVFVKNYFTHNLYDVLLEQKIIKRCYLAFVHGHLKQKSGIINKKIGRHRHLSDRMVIANSGQEAITKYQVKREHKDYSLVELELETGRTHQIRIHLASLNHPILGDDLYGGKSPLITRQALHAYKLQLIHPVTMEPFEVKIPLPPDMENLL